MTKHPESSGSSLPREGSGLDSQLSSSFGKHHPEQSTKKQAADRPNQLSAKPLAAPDPKLRRRSGLVRQEISSGADEKSQKSEKSLASEKKSSASQKSSAPKSTIQSAPRSKNQPPKSKAKPQLTTYAPKSRRDVARADAAVIEQSERPAFLKPPTIDENLLGDSMQAWSSGDEDFESERFGKRLVPIPSFLISTAVHLAVFLALALIAC